MAALLVSLSIMALLMTVVMPVWKHEAQREKEAELVFRGLQYVHAITLFQRKSGPGVYPPSFDILVQQKYLRKKFKDPITNGDFQPVSALLPAGAPAAGSTVGATQPGQTGRGATATGTSTLAQTFTLGSDVPGGIAGVASKSTDQSIRIYNGQTHYNEWVFRVVPQAQTPGAGAAGPNGRGQRGGPPNAAPGPGIGVPGPGPGRGFPGGRGPQGGPFPPNGRIGSATIGPDGRGMLTTPDGRTIALPPPGR